MANNPFVSDRVYDQYRQSYGSAATPMVAPMTREGTTNKALAYFGILILASAGSWVLAAANPGLAMALALVGALGGLGCAVWAGFQPQKSTFLAPTYSVLEGLLLGAVSSLFNAQVPGIVFNAVTLTLGILGAMVLCYKYQIIRVTEQFRSIIIGATIGVAFCYLVSFGARLLFPKSDLMFIHNTGPIGIIVSLFLIGLASMNFLVDFDNIDRGVQERLPKYFESYMGMSVLITLVWVYVEVLRLLMKLNSRR